ncbi:hypothetical protein SAMN05443287_101118 [Micromonospora phaseoli]|uniref:Secreted protein n=1 Tax=Micromonospora phaseoli TaxID=1144548 RepID=A0A1H6RD76_9ACTN|nr:hypothetical protein [Micromonospora phaseoli]PZW03376.1 hypothetical protein CLV64_101118 [Micromonospora phaseoli]GIJ78288.1 hypothetical protein Xph01_27200 [Micromonospora phaseoli]SEI52446.1 hypothetical protein SAMN05443287_101118 [Micromonospora phaseoli]
MSRFFRRKAAAVAIAALALALAGGGIAAAKPTVDAAQPTARTAQQPAVTTASLNSAKAALAKGDSIGTQAVGFYATVVNANGTKARGAGVVIKYGVGQYEVQFGSNVTTGVYVATIGDAGSCCVPPAGEVSVAPRLLTPNGVFIQTRNSAGVAADRPFHLLVHR